MSLFQKILRQLDEATSGAVGWRDVESVLVTLNKKFHALVKGKDIHSELEVSFSRDPRKTSFIDITVVGTQGRRLGLGGRQRHRGREVIFTVDKSNGKIYSAKGYGKPNTSHQYGTVQAPDIRNMTKLMTGHPDLQESLQEAPELPLNVTSRHVYPIVLKLNKILWKAQDQSGEYERRENRHELRIVDKSKYINIDSVRPGDKHGGSGVFMVDKTDGKIYGIKGYGVPNKIPKHQYGTVEKPEMKKMAINAAVGEKAEVMRMRIEDASANAVGGGEVAGLGVGPKGEPGGPPRMGLRRKKDDCVIETTYNEEEIVELQEASFADQKRHAETTYKALTAHGFGGGSSTAARQARLSIPNRSRDAVNVAIEIFLHSRHSSEDWQRAGKMLNKATDLGILWDKKLLKPVNRQRLGIQEDTFAGAEVLDTDMDGVMATRAPKRRWERYAKYVGVEEEGERIRLHARKSKRDIILRDSKTGAMTWLRKQAWHKDPKKDKTH